MSVEEEEEEAESRNEGGEVGVHKQWQVTKSMLLVRPTFKQRCAILNEPLHICLFPMFSACRDTLAAVCSTNSDRVRRLDPLLLARQNVCTQNRRQFAVCLLLSSVEARNVPAA